MIATQQLAMDEELRMETEEANQPAVDVTNADPDNHDVEGAQRNGKVGY